MGTPGQGGCPGSRGWSEPGAGALEPREGFPAGVHPPGVILMGGSALGSGGGRMMAGGSHDCVVDGGGRGTDPRVRWIGPDRFPGAIPEIDSREPHPLSGPAEGQYSQPPVGQRADFTLEYDVFSKGIELPSQ